MKILFLTLVLIGCGRNEPAELDLQDDDGDLIANSYEAEDQKFIAKVNPLENLKGEILVKSKGNIIAVAKIRSWKIESSDALRVLKGQKKDSSPLEYFKESHGLRLEFVNIPSEHSELAYTTVESHLGHNRKRRFDPEAYDDRVYTMSIHLEEESEGIESVELIHDSQSRLVLTKDSRGEFIITGKILRHLYREFSFLEATRSKAEQDAKRFIKDKCRKVYVADGDINEVYYLSKTKDLNFLKEAIGIRGNHLDSQSRHVLQETDGSVGLFSRSAKNEHYHVLVRSEAATIQKVYLESHQTKNFNLERINGERKSSFEINNETLTEANYILQISPLELRQWSFHSEWRHSHQWGRERDFSCSKHHREKSGETSLYFYDNYLTDDLMVTVNGSPVSLESLVSYRSSKRKRSDVPHLILNLVLPPGKIVFSLGESKLGNDFVGIFDFSECGSQKKQTTQVSIESYFGIQFNGFFEN